ncbi:MAG: glycosyltransferase family 4 protein [Deltaproteobacteria bacterium]|nr:glycosyltransferase family 4 protein [Deltaproteobacteria bacterium]
MRLLMVARRFPPDVRSGSETAFEALWQRARARHEVRLLAGFHRDRSLLPPDAEAVDLRQVHRVQGWLRMRHAARATIRSFVPDAVLSNAIEVPASSRPTACIVHDLEFGGERGAAGRRLFYRWRTRRLDRVITVSEAMRRHLVARGLPAGRTVAIPNGVDLDRFRPAPRIARADSRLVICCASRILPGKGQHVAVEALSRLPADLCDRVVLQVVGSVADPAYLDRIRRQARGFPVEFHLDVPDLACWYQQADIAVFPTLLVEGFGFSAVEALACGRPVIHSDQAAVREATGGLGIPVPPGDADALGAAIASLALAPERCESIGRAGRAYLERRRSWDLTWSAYESLLEQMIVEAGP